MQNTQYPNSEDILLNEVTVGFNWVTVLTGCTSTTSGTSLNRVNFDSSAATNADLRGYLAIKDGTPGVRYETRFIRKGTTDTSYGWFLRQVKDSGFEQGEFFYSSVQNLPAGVKADLFAHAYLEINGGTAGDQVSVGFQLDNEPSSRRTSDFAVPKTFAGYATRQGINIADIIETVPAGTHTLKLWAISRSGRPVTVSFRNIEFVSFPTTYVGETNPAYPGTHLSLYQGTTQTVVNSASPPANPKHPNFQNDGWVPVTDEFTMPQDDTEWLNWIGAGSIELLGRRGAWTDARAEIMIEIYHDDTLVPTTDGQCYYRTCNPDDPNNDCVF